MADHTVKLNTGLTMPQIGFGTWQLDNEQEAFEATRLALAAGYRLIDTAAIYGNEESVGRAIRESGVPREDIFVTTKLWKTEHGYAQAREAYEASLQRLGLDYIDLYLIHWPGSNATHRKEAWRAMEELQDEGLAKNIGVSNFTVEHLEDLHTATEVIPAVNQIELHPFNYKNQKPILDYCKQKGIIVEAYSPLVRSEKLDDPLIQKLAATYKRSPAQILLRWSIQQGAVPLPKSSHPDRIKQNLEVFDFELSSEDMTALDNLSDDYSALH